jgi:uncharacterized protein (DUF1330 family)
MSFYFLAALNRHDRERFAEYQRGAQEAAYAAAPDLAFLASAEDLTVEEGELDANLLVLVRFADEAAYRAWWDSEQYQAVIPAREASADTRFVVTFPGRE